ncbi:MAG: EamA family transporter [Mycobacteriaceae bacterium]
MTSRDKALAVTVAVLWGLNFLPLRFGLNHFPPLFFVSLRFLVIAIPVVIFIRRPTVPTRWLLLYGLGFGIIQFAFLFTAMHLGMPTGLASLVLQTSAPFTVLLGGVLLHEKISGPQILGIILATSGIALIGWEQAQLAKTIFPVLLTLVGALGWAFGNLGNRLAKPIDRADSLRLTLWMTAIPPIPMLILSLLIEGPQRDWESITTIFSPSGWAALASLIYIVLFGTIAGSGLWTMLMSRYPASQVAPFSLLVPVVGIGTSWMFLGEKPDIWGLLGTGVVILGVGLPTLAARLRGNSTSTATINSPAQACVV